MNEMKEILIVDDDASSIHILMNLLKDQYTIRTAISGQKALDIAFSDNQPDLILLDVKMPEMDGLQVCNRLKAEEKTKDIPIIFVTASDNPEDQTLGLELGAVDYIIKPIQPLVVQSRINTHLQLSENRRQLQMEKDRYEAELNLAYKILQRFIPEQAPEIQAYDIKALFKPLRGIGGDYYDYFSLSDGSTGIIQADVKRHGVPAALITSMAKTLFSLMNKFKTDPGKFMTMLNNGLGLNIPGFRISAIYGVLSPQSNVFTFANAAHCIPLVFRGQSSKVEEIPLNGPVLGVKPQSKPYATETISLGINDMIFLYSDGVTESIEKIYDKGIDKMKEAILAMAKLPLEEIVSSIYDHIELQLKQSGKDISDDLTIIGIRRTS